MKLSQAQLTVLQKMAVKVRLDYDDFPLRRSAVMVVQNGRTAIVRLETFDKLLAAGLIAVGDFVSAWSTVRRCELTDAGRAAVISANEALTGQVTP